MDGKIISSGSIPIVDGNGCNSYMWPENTSTNKTPFMVYNPIRKTTYNHLKLVNGHNCGIPGQVLMGIQSELTQ